MSIRDELEQIVGEHIDDAQFKLDEFELEAATQSVVDALLARYAVVELPVLPEPDEDGQVYLSTTWLRIDTTGHHGAEIYDENGDPLEYEQIRAAAAEYLAVADRVETR